MSVPPHLGAAALKNLAIAQRVADAHRGIDDTSLFSFVSGSTVDDLVDARSDIDMTVVLARLPGEMVLRTACRSATYRSGEGEWNWTIGDLDSQGGGVASFMVDGIEVQVGYSTEIGLTEILDDLLLNHNPTSVNQKLAEGIAKALPLSSSERLTAIQLRLGDFPDGLARAMVETGLHVKPVQWHAVRNIIERDAALWCREVQIERCYGLLLALSGLNRRWFTRFQFKRMHRFATQLPLAPHSLADRIERLLSSPPQEAFDELHRLEREVLKFVESRMPEVDLRTAWRWHSSYDPV